MRLTKEQIAESLIKLIDSGQIKPEDDSLIGYDLSFLEKRIMGIQNAFPKNTLHAIAIKANPLTSILEILKRLGVGAEAASFPELNQALNCNYEPETIVYDSPAKTVEDIKNALHYGVHINADSFAELTRIDEILKTTKTNSTIGLRVNPQVGVGAIESSSTAGEYSKFGVPLTEFYEKIQEAYLAYPWLTGIHVHIGSQGCPLELFKNAYARITEFINTTNRLLKKSGRTINIIDIGGGLPVAYRNEDSPPTIEEFSQVVNHAFEKLEIDDYRLITEFGRYVFANCGWVASRVEYVKHQPGVKTALIHVGADMFVRRVYRPQDWHHDLFVVDKDGRLKTGIDDTPYVIAGPLCFSGDILANHIKLPCIEEGDFVVIRDAGAYTLSMWSRYNSRCMPKVVGYYDNADKVIILKERETAGRLNEFWS
ncbi:MAG: diaminopimelate decarboxylase [candidate division Zixibacteria bacterium]|nr:diaminopimelate decarboxylase [candidate division Zixibacteria bacterium]